MREFLVRVGTGEEPSGPGGREGRSRGYKDVAPASGDLGNGLAPPSSLQAPQLRVRPPMGGHHLLIPSSDF